MPLDSPVEPLSSSRSLRRLHYSIFELKPSNNNNKFITIFFGFLLFALFGISFLFPISATLGNIGTTKRCIVTKFQHYGSLPNLIHSIFDTLVFLAISFRILTYTVIGDTFGARMRSFFQGVGLPTLSRS